MTVKECVHVSLYTRASVCMCMMVHCVCMSMNIYVRVFAYMCVYLIYEVHACLATDISGCVPGYLHIPAYRYVCI